MTKGLAALTGATGFLGRALAPALQAEGFSLRVLTRPGAELPTPADAVIGRLSDHPALARLVEGADVVIHAAGLIKARGRAAFEAVNVEGARGVAEACLSRAPGAHLLMISSLSAREPGLSDYAASKAGGEAAARQVLTPGRLTIVRPPAVYGPGDRETLALFRAAGILPALPLPGPDHARLALIHVADAAAQIVALAGRAPSGATFALCDGRPEGYGWREIMRTAAEAMGRHPRLFRLPAGAVLAIGAANGALGRLGAGPQVLTLGKAREMLHPDWSVRAAERAPDPPACRFDLEAGFADAVAWYRASGWL